MVVKSKKYLWTFYVTEATNQEDKVFYKCKWKKAHEVHLFFGNQVAGLLPIKKEVIGRPVNMTLGVKVVDTAMEVKNTNVAPSWTYLQPFLRTLNPRDCREATDIKWALNTAEVIGRSVTMAAGMKKVVNMAKEVQEQGRGCLWTRNAIPSWNYH